MKPFARFGLAIALLALGPTVAAAQRASIHVVTLDEDLSLQRVIGTSTAMASSGGHSYAFEVEHYQRLCSAPCDVDLEEGDYQLGVARGDGSPIRAPGTLHLTGSSTLRIAYSNREPLRIIGWTTFVVGSLLGGGLAIAGGTGHLDLGLLITGIVVFALACIFGFALAFMGDGASIDHVSPGSGVGAAGRTRRASTRAPDPDQLRLLDAIAPCDAEGATVDVALTADGRVMRVASAGGPPDSVECIDDAVHSAQFDVAHAPRTIQVTIMPGGRRSSDERTLRDAIHGCEGVVGGTTIAVSIGAAGNPFAIEVSGSPEGVVACLERGIGAQHFARRGVEASLRVTLGAASEPERAPDETPAELVPVVPGARAEDEARAFVEAHRAALLSCTGHAAAAVWVEWNADGVVALRLESPRDSAEDGCVRFVGRGSRLSSAPGVAGSVLHPIE